eukprot:71678_1
MGRRGRSSAWINARKSINAKINNKEWWQNKFSEEFQREGIDIKINELPLKCTEKLSLDTVFDINSLLSILIDEQILFYARCKKLQIEREVMEWIKYNDNNLKRRMNRKIQKSHVAQTIKTISLNIACKLRLVLHKNSTSYTVSNKQYSFIVNRTRELYGKTLRIRDKQQKKNKLKKKKKKKKK